ncbi:hypothetical protein JW926_04815 [Candidatus Sumerlaeota bacterium]|nr:hypothetical protein [Candidatus Sumerlaeota bacterium]
MKAYRHFTVGLIFLILGVFFLGCETEEEKLKKEEDLRLRVERTEMLSRKIEELNAEIEKMETTLESLDDVVFRAKMSLSSLKKAQQDIEKTTYDLKTQILPAPFTPKIKSHPVLWTIIVVVIILAALYLYWKLFYRPRTEVEEETPLEEGTPFDSSSPFEREEGDVLESDESNEEER